MCRAIKLLTKTHLKSLFVFSIRTQNQLYNVLTKKFHKWHSYKIDQTLIQFVSNVYNTSNIFPNFIFMYKVIITCNSIYLKHWCLQMEYGCVVYKYFLRVPNDLYLWDPEAVQWLFAINNGYDRVHYISILAVLFMVFLFNHLNYIMQQIFKNIIIQYVKKMQQLK